VRHQAAERRRATELASVGAEHRIERRARLVIGELVEQVPRAERVERRAPGIAPERLARAGEERLFGVAAAHGSRSSCLAIVSSCIC
jgi:hypothetical protein